MKRFIQWTVVAVITLTTAAACIAFYEPPPPSLYKPELKRELTQKERWQLDFEMANELSMHTNTRRFDAPNMLKKRAKWVEDMAQWYPMADLLQQILDIRAFKARNNEAAFNRLVELGKQGDVAARCMAHFFYLYHAPDVTKTWKYSYDDVARLALEVKAAGHPACVGMEGTFYLRGLMGYPKDRMKAKPYELESAIAGFYQSQYGMIGYNLIKGPEIQAKDIELSFCWERVTNQNVPAIDFYGSCSIAKRGLMFGANGEYVISDPLKPLVRKWCEPTQEQWKVTAQDCANLERQYEGK